MSSDFNFTDSTLTIGDDGFFSSFVLKTLKNPLKTINSELGLDGTLPQRMDYTGPLIFKKSHQSEIFDGFHLLFHDPYELPSFDSSHFYSPPWKFMNYWIIPEITSYDDSLKDYDINEYLSIQLKFTKSTKHFILDVTVIFLMKKHLSFLNSTRRSTVNMNV